jgi:hypothetical protein
MKKLDLKTIEETPHLLEILLQCEDILDSLDIYVFKHWLSGEVVQGPRIRKFWVTLSLKYDYEDMPDPRAALRLLKHGVYVKYNKVKVEHLHTDHERYCWILDMEFPRKLLNGMNNSGVDFYNQEVDADDVNQAEDEGVDTDTAYQTQDDGMGGGSNTGGDTGDDMSGDDGDDMGDNNE